MKIKKILSIFFAILLVLAPTISYAENSENLEIINKDKDNVSILGFKYELYDLDTNRVIKEINLINDSSYKTDLRDGNYKLVEIDRPDGYSKSYDVTFTIPSKDGSRKIKIAPKHYKTNEKPQVEYHKEYSSTGTQRTNIPALITITSLICAGFVLKKKVI